MHRLNEGALSLFSDYQALFDENVDCPTYCHAANTVMLTELGFRGQSISWS